MMFGVTKVAAARALSGVNRHIHPIILGEYSPSQNGIIVAPSGIAQCIAGGGKGHDTTKPKILLTYD